MDYYPLGAEVRYYYVSGVDIHENEGDLSEVLPVIIQSTMLVTYSESWNLVGLPLTVINPGYEYIFPDALSGSLFSYSGTYQTEDIMEIGEGYLLRMTENSWGVFVGYPNEEVTISLTEGWNLFSGLSTSLYPDALYNYDIVQYGTIYGLDNIYYQPENIEPGYGYWVYATGTGDITLSSYDNVARQFNYPNHLENGNSLSFSTKDYSQSLYFGVEVPKNEQLSYGLPPVFSQIPFDVRFGNNMKFVTESGEITVVSKSDQLTVDFDIQISAGENMNWVLTAVSGTEYILDGISEIVVPTEDRYFLSRESVIPKTFALHQNFPNPFNPITYLQYDLPIESHVNLKIYDMLGHEIAQLVSSKQSPGIKTVKWDARDSMGRPVSAGVYLYQIQANDASSNSGQGFTETKKMVLLK